MNLYGNTDLRRVRQAHLGVLPTTWLRWGARLCRYKGLPAQAGIVDFGKRTPPLHSLLILIQHVLENWLNFINISVCDRNSARTHLLFEHYMLALPVLHHAQRLECAHNIIRIDGHFLGEVKDHNYCYISMILKHSMLTWETSLMHIVLPERLHR